MEQQEYNQLINDVKYKIMDLLDKVTDEYLDGFVDTVDCEIANIKSNRDFYQKQTWEYETALSFACEEILRLQGYSEINDEFIDKRIKLETQFLEDSKVGE